MDPLNITKGSIVFSRFIPNVDDSLHSFSSYCTEHERRPHAAPMTDEQREENRKRREAYKRKKSHALNKENDQGLHIFELTIGLLI